MKTRLLAVVASGLSAMTGSAQQVVSARAGLVHYVEGDVTVNGRALGATPATKLFSQFPEVKEGEDLVTGEGRAEILLSPGVVLRVGENSTVRMLSSKLTDSVLEIRRGDAVLDVAELDKENDVHVTIRCGKASVAPRKAGVYKFHSGEPPSLMVYDGSAEVTVADERKSAKKGWMLALADGGQARKFETDQGDTLLRWSMRRSGYLAMANVSAAKSAHESQMSFRSGSWLWNPYFGMFTYLPVRGVICNTLWGACFYSPSRVYAAIYRPAPVVSAGGFAGGRVGYGYDPVGGYAISSQRTYGAYNPPAAVGAPAASAGDGGARGAESAAPRGGEGGGRSQ